MPKMDGLEFTRVVMEDPASDPGAERFGPGGAGANIFQMLEAGALDILAKPRERWVSITDWMHELITKIKILAGVMVIRKRGEDQRLPSLRE